MRFKSCAVLCVLVSFLIASPLSLCAADDPELIIWGTDMRGVGNYLKKNDDGSFADQQYLVDLAGVGGICMSAGVGDFNNDGGLDLIAAKGIYAGSVYLFQKVEPGSQIATAVAVGQESQFAAPVAVGQWNAGAYVMGLAVGNFNEKEDENLDFVVNYYQSSSCELFLGDGQGHFSSVLLPDTAALRSAAVDAADVNNDGHLDFVTAPYGSSDKFYVNLGNGDGTFKTLSFDAYQGSPYSGGLAVADFDNDGNADVAATNNNYLDLYKGNGDGTFTFASRITDDNFTSSPIDNFDVNNDEIQDLVVSRYGKGYPNYGKGIAVLLGNGDGTFTFDRIYGAGDNGLVFSAVAAPSVNKKKNKKPVPALDYDSDEIIAGNALVFDGTGSYDEDGEVVGYAWDFGDGGVSSEASPEHIYYDAGEYIVTLTVTDDKGDTDVTQSQVYVETIPAVVDLQPKIIDLKGTDKWVVASIDLPDGYRVSQIDINSVRLSTDDGLDTSAVATRRYGFLAWFERHRFGKNKLWAKFDRQAIIDAISEPSDEVILHIQGKVNHNGGMADFSGSDIVRAVVPERTKRHFWHQSNHINRNLIKKCNSRSR
jgi:PKD repeat protein